MTLRSRTLHGAMVAAVIALVVSPAVAEEASIDHWPHWRGPLGSGASPTATPPIEWSESENVAWKVALPGAGHSSPVVWGNRVFVTCALPVGDPFEPRYDNVPGSHNNLPISSRWRFVALAVDRRDGRILWQTTLREAIPQEGGHETGSLASASPVTDGERVYAFFGSQGLYALDAATGEQLWDVDFGDMQTKHGHGEGSSPVLHGDRLFVNWDHDGPSFIVALDTASGRELWRRERDEKTSWSSPIIAEVDGEPQLIVAATKRIRAYRPADGELLWECGGLSDNVVATPVFEPASGILVVTSSYDFQSMLALSLSGARGDITRSRHVVWARQRRTPYVPSPLLFRGHVYFLAHYQGVLSRVEIATGDEATGPFRLGDLRELYASPVAAEGRLYFTDRSGSVLVLKDGPEPEPLALNQLDDRFSATPALIGSDLLLRGEKHLYCIRREDG